MREPSVLDYVKSKLAFWTHTSIEIPAPDQPTIEEGQSEHAAYSNETPLALAGSEIVSTREGVPQGDRSLRAAAPQAAARTREASSGVLLVLGALALALIAQAMLEPPNRAVIPAVAFYAISAVLIGMAYFYGLVTPASATEDQSLPEYPAVPEYQETPEELEAREDSASGLPAEPAVPEGASKRAAAKEIDLNFLSLMVGLVLMIAAFYLFGTKISSTWLSNNPNEEVPIFSFLNTTAWLLSIGYLVRAFYLTNKKSGQPGLRSRVTAFLKEPCWHITLTRWTIVVLVVVVVVLFFRFYRLNSVPLDAVSDQAEKLLDVNDVLTGTFRVFFPRNTGREAFQFYWTALMVKVFNTGISFLSLKIGTTLIGLLALYYMYRIGEEIGNRWVGLLAVLFCGFSYWAQTQARIALRFTLYPGFYAPMLYCLIRGLRRSNRNDFIWAGIWLGIGLHGYTSYRIVPFVVLACFAIYLLHNRAAKKINFALSGLLILGLVSLAVFIPLFRYALEPNNLIASRALTRIGQTERAFPGSPAAIFFQNTWNALTMFFWDNGDVWVHSIPHRPALDVISAALFFLGLVVVILRYVRKRSWVDLFMLVSIPLLLLPSILSLAFPNENPNLNRTSGAYIPVFLILAIGLEGLVSGLKRGLSGRAAVVVPALVGLALVLFSASSNFDLVFNQYDKIERESGWNTPEMGAVVRRFDESFGRNADAWVVAYPYWVDTRLVGIEAGYPARDMAINVEDLQSTGANPRNKLFLLNPQDSEGLSQLKSLYPEGRYWMYKSTVPGKDFYIFLALATNDMPLEGVDAQGLLSGAEQSTSP